MTKLYGMTVKQLKDTLDEMKTVYPYKDETTRMGEVKEFDPPHVCHVELITMDEHTGVRIVMSKSVNAGSEEW